MEVRDEHVIEAADARIGHGGLNAQGVTTAVTGPACIDEKRCVGSRIHEVRRLTSLHINGVNEQAAGRVGLGLHGLEQRAAQQDGKAGAQAATGKKRAGVIGDSHVPESVHGDHPAAEEPIGAANRPTPRYRNRIARKSAPDELFPAEGTLADWLV
jgi:hypothetical protein